MTDSFRNELDYEHYRSNLVGYLSSLQAYLHRADYNQLCDVTFPDDSGSLDCIIHWTLIPLK